MKNKGLMLWGIIALVVGVLGLAFGLLLLGQRSDATLFSSNGQRIYYTGADASGPIPRTIAGGGMMGFDAMGAGACVDCHGRDGRGGRVGMMFGTIDIPDIRYVTLTTTRSQDGTTVPAWTDTDIARAIRDGVEPNGQPLKAPMPRWNMTDADINEVIAYLKELSAR